MQNPNCSVRSEHEVGLSCFTVYIGSPIFATMWQCMHDIQSLSCFYSLKGNAAMQTDPCQCVACIWAYAHLVLTHKVQVDPGVPDAAHLVTQLQGCVCGRAEAATGQTMLNDITHMQQKSLTCMQMLLGW